MKKLLLRSRAAGYRLFYAYPVNVLVRNLIKLGNKGLKKKRMLGVSGKVRIPVGKASPIILEANESSHVAYFLYFQGYKKYEFTEIFCDLIRQCNSFFDIGANIGYFSLLAEKYNPKIRITAFEPGNGAYHFLQKNFAHSGNLQLKAEKIALSDKEGEIIFHELTNNKFPYLKYFMSGASTTVDMGYNHPQQIYSVPCTTLDQYVEKNNISSLDLIKLDTEFNEHLVLSSSQRVLKEMRPIIISEVYPKFQDLVYEQIRDFNYFIYQHNEGKLVKMGHFNEADEEGDRNFFLVPAEKESLIRPYLSDTTGKSNK